jgi:hypothetical protein
MICALAGKEAASSPPLAAVIAAAVAKMPQQITHFRLLSSSINCRSLDAIMITRFRESRQRFFKNYCISWH